MNSFKRMKYLETYYYKKHLVTLKDVVYILHFLLVIS